MLIEFLTLIHLILIFLPVMIFFIPIKYLKDNFKFIFLLLILIPMHWVYFENQCLFTLAGKKLGNMTDTQTSSSFSEKYMKWLYKPIMNLLGWEWNNEGINKMVNLHWTFNFILLWYYLFYVGKCILV